MPRPSGVENVSPGVGYEQQVGLIGVEFVDMNVISSDADFADVQFVGLRQHGRAAA